MKTQHIDPTSLAAALAAGECQLIDVREPVEHAESHVSGSKLIPLGQLNGRCGELDRTRPVVVMCHAGKRGETAAAQLREGGFQDVRNLEGGMLAWNAAGLPCIRGTRKVLPLMRQVQLVLGTCVFLGALLAVTVDPRWAYLCMFFGGGLLFAGLCGCCGLAICLSKMPWNKTSNNSSCTSGS